MTDENEMENNHRDDVMPPTGSQGSGNTKWIAIIIVLVVVISGLAVAYAMKPTGTAAATSATGSYLPGASIVALSGSNYNLVISGQNLQSISTNYGDHTTGEMNFSADPNSVTLNHNYINSGLYLMYFSGTRTNGTSLGNDLVPMNASVVVPISASQSTGFMQILSNYSTNQSTVAPTIFTGDHANVSLFMGFFTEPHNSINTVFAQSYTIFKNGQQYQGQTPLNYVFSNTSGYGVSSQNSTVNLTSLSQGYYTVQLTTYTGVVNATTGFVSNPSSVTSYIDFAIYASNNYHIASSRTVTASGTFTSAELETGGFRTLDPALAYDTVSDEILSNTYQTLTTYQGSNSGAYAPYLAATLPTTANGGVNTNTKTYTQTVNSAVAGYSAHSYTVKIAPGENYTFHINPNATFQNGTAVTAWDVMYSLTRDLLFTADPGAP
ncbi:ABC-type peptide transport system, solute-binding component, partial [mine drainage metagenome]